MASPFKSLDDLLLSVVKAALQAHLDPSKVDGIIANQEEFKRTLKYILENQQAAAQDLLAIKAYLGVPDPRIGATQDDVNKLGALLKNQTDVVNEFDRTIPVDGQLTDRKKEHLK